MRYLIIGAGGVGSVVGGFLSLAGCDVSFITRGETYQKIIENNGIIINSEDYGNLLSKVKVYYEDSYTDTPDVIFVCVKGYSLNEVIPFLSRVANKNTVVIPLLNIFGTGSTLQKLLPNTDVLDGCIYIMADILSPGVIMHRKCPIRLVFGYRDGHSTSVLEEIRNDLLKTNIIPVLSLEIKKDTFLKFSLISAMAAVGVYYDSTVGEILESNEKTDFYLGISKEIEELGKKMGFNYPFSLVERNYKSMLNITKDGTTSLQKDLKKGKRSEIDGLIYEVIRLADEYGLPITYYDKLRP